MVKKAALSVRIPASAKAALDKAAAEEHRSTSALIEIILQDWLQSRQQFEAGCDPMDMRLPTGKTVREMVREQLQMLIKDELKNPFLLS